MCGSRYISLVHFYMSLLSNVCVLVYVGVVCVCVCMMISPRDSCGPIKIATCLSNDNAFTFFATWNENKFTNVVNWSGVAQISPKHCQVLLKGRLLYGKQTQNVNLLRNSCAPTNCLSEYT